MLSQLPFSRSSVVDDNSLSRICDGLSQHASADEICGGD